MAYTRQILTTIALPYANGPLHFGHLLEAIQADIWVRYQKMRGHECYFICGSDAHGTAISIKAQEQGIAPEVLVDTVRQSFQQDYAGFNIQFDNFYTTHSPENQRLANSIYTQLCQRGDIVKRTISQAYDPVKNMFLPDRYVKGACPRCKATDQYGDNLSLIHI